MVNCNPETVSTDYDTSDRLYFEPLTAEDVIELVRVEQAKGKVLGCIVQFGGQTPLKLAAALEAAEIPILGTSPDAIDLAEDRRRFQKFLEDLNLLQPENGTAYSAEEAVAVAEKLGFPLVIRPSYVLGGRAMEIVHGMSAPEGLHGECRQGLGSTGPVLLDRYLSDAIEVDVDALSDGTERLCRRHHGTYRGSRHPFRRQRLLAAALFAVGRDHRRDRAPDQRHGAEAGRRSA